MNLTELLSTKPKSKPRQGRGLFTSCFKLQSSEENPLFLLSSNLKSNTTNSKTTESNELANQNKESAETGDKNLNGQVLGNEIPFEQNSSSIQNARFVGNQFDTNYLQNNMIIYNNPSMSYNVNQVRFLE